MNNETDLWNCETYLGTYYNTPNNTDPIFPQWGPYTPSFSPLATLQCTASSPMVGMCNVTASVNGVPALVTNFFQNARGSVGSVGLFCRPCGVTSHEPGRRPVSQQEEHVDLRPDLAAHHRQHDHGVHRLRRPARGNLLRLPAGTGLLGQDVLHLASRSQRRQRLAEEVLRAAQRHRLQQRHGVCGTARAIGNSPSGNYIINYKAILNWIVNTGPNPFPPQLRAGNDLVLLVDPDRRARPRPTPGPTRTRRSPTPSSGSGRNTSISCSASGRIRSGTSRPRATRRAATGRISPAAAALRVRMSRSPGPIRPFARRHLDRSAPITRCVRGTGSGSGRRR